MVQGLVRYPGTGCIVEFMQGNAPQIAIVLEEQNGRLRLLLPNRRETSLQVSRILPWTGPLYEKVSSRDAMIEVLEKHRLARQEASVDPLELWEMAQGEVDAAPADWFAELAASDPDVDLVAACAHALLNTKTHFKFNSPNFEVFPEAVANARLEEQRLVRQREAIVGRGGAFVRLLWDIYLKKQPAAAVAAAKTLDPEIVDHLRKMILKRLADPETQEDDALWRMMVKGIPDDQFVPLHLAEAWGLVGPHHNFMLDRVGYEPGDAWSEAYRAETDTLLESIAAESGDACLSLPVISIDAPVTRDIDDAFHIARRPDGGWDLILALACPADIWNFGGDLDRAVLQRATSLYLPEATHHMLPQCLGINGYSLLAGEVRPSLLVRCVINADGEVIECTPSRGTVRLTANLQYDDCEAALDGVDTPASPYREMLEQALAVALKHQSLRVAKGAVIIERPDQNILLEGEGQNVRVSLETDNLAPRAHLLVSELMILVNAAVPRWAMEHGIHLIYRTQDVAIPREFAGIWSSPVDIARVVRALSPAIMETAPRPHAGLGEAVYAPSSSPLRRYSDMVNEAQILHYLSRGRPRWDLAALKDLVLELNVHLEASMQVQRFWPRYWKLEYFRQQGDKVWWPAVITDENDAFVTVNLPREQLIARARRNLFGERTVLGQELEVRIGKVHPLQNDFRLLETREI